jgi:putative membrane protein
MKKYLFVAASVMPLMFACGAAAAAPADQPGHQNPAPGTTNDTMSAVKDATGHAVGVISAEMTTTTKGFAEAAATSDLYEVAAGKIAQERSQKASVKDFAAKMIAAHTETSNKLKAALSAAHADVALPTSVDDRRQGMLDELRGAKAEDFDGRYMAQQVDAHKEALILMKGYAKDGDIAGIKALASKTVPTIQSHLNMAEKIDSTMNKQSSLGH